MFTKEAQIYEDVIKFIDEQGRTFKEIYTDEVKEFVYKLVIAVESGRYNVDFFEYGDYLSWFDETVRDDFEELDELSYKEVVDIRDLTGAYIKDEYNPDMWIDSEEDYDPLESDDWNEDLEDVMF